MKARNFVGGYPRLFEESHYPELPAEQTGDNRRQEAANGQLSTSKEKLLWQNISTLLKKSFWSVSSG